MKESSLELYLQLSFKYFADRCFILKLFSKAWMLNTTFRWNPKHAWDKYLHFNFRVYFVLMILQVVLTLPAQIIADY